MTVLYRKHKSLLGQICLWCNAFEHSRDPFQPPCPAMQGVSEACIQLPTAPRPHPHTSYVEKFPKLFFKHLSGKCTVGRLLWGWRPSPGAQEPVFLSLVAMTDTVVASQACMCSASPLGVYLQIKRKRQQMLSHYFTRNWMTRSRKRKGRKELCQKECVPQRPGLS